MQRLSRHYKRFRMLYPHDQIMILFDIDGTILDMRHMIRHVLQSYDRRHGTGFFSVLKVADITRHETDVERLLDEASIPGDRKAEVLEWFEKECWSREAILESHRPFTGVMEVIRWFQTQPKTYVGLNTGRPDFIRADTLRSLNKIGQEYKVTFRNDLLYMNPHGWNREVAISKVSGVLHFQQSGYRIFAYIDNEPENLEAVAEVDPLKQILLLHADTLFKSKRWRLPGGAVSGQGYDPAALIREMDLSRPIGQARIDFSFAEQDTGWPSQAKGG